MSSTDKKSEVKTQKAEESIKEKEKTIGDAKTDTSAHKRPSSEVNSADDEGKQKVLKTDHKDADKENGESEEKFEEGEGGDEDDDDIVPEGDDFDEEGEGDDDDEGADEGDDDEEDA